MKQAITVSRSVLVVLIGLTTVSSAILKGPREPRKQPNILLLMADDMGYGELGSYGQQTMRTPYLDQLAREGVRFTNFYIGSSVCSPSRAVAMTGIHTGRVSIRANGGMLNGKRDRVPLKKSEVTIPEMLKGAGYQTAFIGKWHLGSSRDESTWAKGRGFDYSVQEQWADKTHETEKFTIHMQYKHDGTEIFYDKDQHDCLDEFRTNLAFDFLKNERDDEKPLFLFMSYRTPHAHEPYIREKTLYADKGWPDIQRQHAARVTMLDLQVKRLLDKLKDMGELENTFVVFTSDNGATIEGGHDYTFFNCSGGLRGHKRHLYEGGIREPCIVSWPRKMKGKRVSHHISAGYDLMPTFAELAGIEAPSQTTGISFLPEILGQEQKTHEFVYFEIHEGGIKQAVRVGDWKAVRHYEAQRTELYNLKKDHRELDDVSYRHPQVVERLNEIMKRESQPSPHYPVAGNFFEKSSEKK